MKITMTNGNFYITKEKNQEECRFIDSQIGKLLIVTISNTRFGLVCSNISSIEYDYESH